MEVLLSERRRSISFHIRWLWGWFAFSILFLVNLVTVDRRGSMYFVIEFLGNTPMKQVFVAIATSYYDTCYTDALFYQIVAMLSELCIMSIPLVLLSWIINSVICSEGTDVLLPESDPSLEYSGNIYYIPWGRGVTWDHIVAYAMGYAPEEYDGISTVLWYTVGTHRFRRWKRDITTPGGLVMTNMVAILVIISLVYNHNEAIAAGLQQCQETRTDPHGIPDIDEPIDPQERLHPEITLTGEHIWPDILRYGTPTNNVTDERGKLVIMTWCHMLESVPERYGIHGDLCHIDRYKNHTSSKSILLQNHLRNYRKSMYLTSALTHIEQHRDICISERLWKFMKNEKHYGTQFSGSSTHVFTLHTLRMNAGCIDLETIFIPSHEIEHLELWPLQEDDESYVSHCELGDRFIEELYLYNSNDGDESVRVLRTIGDRFLEIRRIAPPSSEEREKYYFSPVMKHGPMWSTMSSVDTFLRHYRDRSQCHELHQRIRAFICSIPIGHTQIVSLPEV